MKEVPVNNVAIIRPHSAQGTHLQVDNFQETFCVLVILRGGDIELFLMSSGEGFGRVNATLIYRRNLRMI